ncbi:MAG: TonB-dependent receptor, partial [Holophagae bacterium]|nr:TonB-dependent receptor [Holophagae bacterium]
FSGVINVITKQAGDINGWEVSTGYGSFNSGQHNLLFGKAFGELEVAFDINHLKTDGYGSFVAQDSQTLYDQLMGTSASLAPGHTKEAEEKYEAYLTIKYKGLTLEGRYLEKDWNNPFGATFSILNRESVTKTDEYFVFLSYEKNIGEALNFSFKAYRNESEAEDYQTLAVIGGTAFTPAGPVIAADGARYLNAGKFSRTGGEILATLEAGDSNTVITGFSYNKTKQYDNWSEANAFPNQDGTINLLPSYRDITDLIPWDLNNSRTLKAVFFEDLWDIRDDMRLTMGARYDTYSDFGDCYSPRAGFAWEFIRGYDLKLLYGRAFLAPSYNQYYAGQFGNPDLKPEKKDEFEVSLGADFSNYLSGRITGFKSKTKDHIDLNMTALPLRFDNFGKVRGEGVEVEMKYDFGRGSYISANYTFQETKDLDTGAHGMRPKHKGNVMANIRLSRYLNFYSNLYFQDHANRPQGDNREEVSGYGVVNTTLIARKFLKQFKGLELRASVYNLFDKKYESHAWPGTLDYIMPDRHWLVELRYRFD